MADSDGAVDGAGRVEVTPFAGLDAAAARAFTDRWLPAWTGNRPELLTSFYAEDAIYTDPGIRSGAHGRAALLAYFRRLLARYPEVHAGAIDHDGIGRPPAVQLLEKLRDFLRRKRRHAAFARHAFLFRKFAHGADLRA